LAGLHDLKLETPPEDNNTNLKAHTAAAGEGEDADADDEYRRLVESWDDLVVKERPSLDTSYQGKLKYRTDIRRAQSDCCRQP
jgi:hypothetical protein